MSKRRQEAHRWQARYAKHGQNPHRVRRIQNGPKPEAPPAVKVDPLSLPRTYGAKCHEHCGCRGAKEWFASVRREV